MQKGCIPGNQVVVAVLKEVDDARQLNHDFKLHNFQDNLKILLVEAIIYDDKCHCHRDSILGMLLSRAFVSLV